MQVLEQQSAVLPVLRTLCLQPEWFCTYAVGLEPDSSLSQWCNSICLQRTFVPIYAPVSKDRKVLIKLSLSLEGHMIATDLI